MSAPRTIRRTAAFAAASAAASAAAAAVLFGLGGSAAADPPAMDFDPCSNSLDQVTQWPGTLGDGSTHFSDPYESYLLRQPACTSTP
jgi:hypothetical protein